MDRRNPQKQPESRHRNADSPLSLCVRYVGFLGKIMP
uniref:Uncharacterized protein n=1 Tax=Anguilla anguilla TaxID=7936 RepID=A0A0E9V0D5_ANGAN